jgi:hypothetical protein
VAVGAVVGVVVAVGVHVVAVGVKCLEEVVLVLLVVVVVQKWLQEGNATKRLCQRRFRLL